MHAQHEPAVGIRLRDVVKHFGRVGAVNSVSLDLARGQLLALLGPSGCGKTTTLRLIAGFERVDAGTIEIGGQVVAGPRVHLPPEKRRVGMVFQEYALFPHMTVADNVRFGLQNYGGDPGRRVAEVLEMVGMGGLDARMPHELSGGQQQRVALARALAPEPDLILLDEPFSNLDAGLRVRVRSEVRAILRRANATAIFVTTTRRRRSAWWTRWPCSSMAGCVRWPRPSSFTASRPTGTWPSSWVTPTFFPAWLQDAGSNASWACWRRRRIFRGRWTCSSGRRT